VFAHLFRPKAPLWAVTFAALLGFVAFPAGKPVRAAGPPPARPKAEDHFRAARQAAQRRDFARAREELATCIRLGLDNADVRLLAARTARRAGDSAEAQKQLAECRRLKGPPEAVRLEEALLRAQRGELAGVEKGLLADVKKGHPDGVLILEALARGYMEAYRLREALLALDEWTKRRPDDAQALFLRAQVRERGGDGQAWGNAVPNLRSYAYAPGLMKDAPGEGPGGAAPAQALEDYRRVLALDPENDAARLRLAQGLLDSQQAQEALPHLERLHKRHPKNAAVRLGLARCQLLLGKEDEAGKILDGLLAEQPRSAAALAERGRLLLQQGKAAEAEKSLRRAVELAPSDTQALYQLSVCLNRAGKRVEGQKTIARLKALQDNLSRVGDLLKKMDESPQDPAPRCQAGLLLLGSGFEAEGVRWLHRALLLDPRHRPAHQALADYYQRTGNRELADRHRKLAQ
jgi:predicted Zn-dependent protease